MSFVKLDTGILDSTLWLDRNLREVFITALLMAEPIELREPTPQIAVNTLDETGWKVPAGWYGFVRAAGLGIVHRSGVDQERGMVALEMLGNPELTSRSPEFEGRRLVRIGGGFIVLNFMKYRERDHTTAERSKRYRARVAAQRALPSSQRDATQSRRDATPKRRDITQAEAEAEADLRSKPKIKITPRLRAEPVPAGQKQPKPEKNPKALVKLVHTVLDDNPDSDPNDLHELVKTAASKTRFHYVSGDISEAVSVALAQRRRGPGRPAKPRATARRAR